MARDIAFVAEKDTPEGAGTPTEPGPLTDGPRSEGAPAARTVADEPAGEVAPPPPDPLQDADDTLAPSPDERASESAGLPSEAAEEPVSAAPPSHAEPLAEPETAETESPPAPAVQQASSEPPPPAVEIVQATPPSSDPDADRVPAPDGDASPADPDAPASSAEDTSSASFTSAAEDLFRPPELDSDDDTHLITTGRRFSPKLSVPEPEPVSPPAEVETSPAPPPASPWKRRLWTGARYAAYAIAAYLALVLLLIVLFRFVNPPGSMLMLTKLLGGTAIDRTWVPFEAISPALARAVIVSEDSRFCAHRGIDMQAMRQALQEASRGAPRGASTISMQVTKNLFLWNAKSYLRKVIEIPLTLVMEVIWPKARIIEVYLNIAEWGPGVFGAEAAARHHFNKPASKLTEREAALLAAALPNPRIRVASNPGPRTSRMARVIQTRVKAFGSVARCVVAPAPPAPPAADKARTPVKAPAKNTPAKKPPAKKTQPKQEPQDWAPTLRFGP